MKLLERLKGRGITAILIRASTGTATLQLLNMAAGLLTGMTLSRVLGVEGLGRYGLAMATASYFQVPLESGFSQIVLREVASKGFARGALRTLMTALRFELFLAVLLLGGVLIAAMLSNRSSASWLLALGFAFLVSATNIVAAGVQGTQRIVRGQVATLVVRPIIFLMGLGAFVVAGRTGTSEQHVLAIQVAAAAVGLLVAAAQLAAAVRAGESGDDPESISGRQLWLGALPIAASEAARVLQGNAAISVLGLVGTVESAGLFRVASSTWTMVMIPLTLFNGATAPLIARLYANEPKRLQSTLAKIAFGMTGGVVVLSAPVFLAGPTLLSLLFGEQFSVASDALRILCVGALINAFFGANTTLLNMTGRERLVARAFLVSVVVLVAALVPLTYLWGDVGAALASILGMASWNIILWVDAKRQLRLDTSLFAFVQSRERWE